ncbi:electron transport protein HydN [Sporobacter termitidis DSM 10068]|uniref:Electron transport protein HydN n=1 Tax=Sporobacter termitidis DSM 10068 TaxID=1123282 RepID=A0A1M5TZC3_9FIRM|nr:4Fe-4S dicluster domain-containing protein [Sporobacter termitidis]SHH56044.1 electron transport protein HydN [Sporobacter termitidis DSM 10068]
MNAFVKGNPDLCMGCRTCMVACVVSHTGRHIFELDPDDYTFNPKLHMVKTRAISVPVQCKHCENPACMAACPQKCIHMEDGTVFIDTENCIGCKACMEACPVGAIDMAPVSGVYQPDGKERYVANKCDLCREQSGGPACIRVCPTEALKLVSYEEIADTAQERRLAAAKANADGSLGAAAQAK